MNSIRIILTCVGLAAGLGLAGCGEDGHGHDHDGDEHLIGGDYDEGAEHGAPGDGDHGHDHDETGGHEEGVGHDDDDGHAEGSEHGYRHSLGTVEIGGVVLSVVRLGDLEPGGELHLDVGIEAGARPAFVRVWVGEESGGGALKSRLDVGETGMHGHVETPAALGGTERLWIEVEGEDGTTSVGSVALGD